MRISDWSSDVCSSDLMARDELHSPVVGHVHRLVARKEHADSRKDQEGREQIEHPIGMVQQRSAARDHQSAMTRTVPASSARETTGIRSEEHTSELQSLMRISYAVFCLKKKKKHINNTRTRQK